MRRVVEVLLEIFSLVLGRVLHDFEVIWRDPLWNFLLVVLLFPVYWPLVEAGQMNIVLVSWCLISAARF